MIKILWRAILLLIKLSLMIALGSVTGAVLAVYLHYVQQLPELNAAVNYEPYLITRVFDRNGKFLAEFARERRILVPLSQVPEVMQQALISIEDSSFYSHRGLDILGIARAAWINFRAGGVVQGGSTITQQLAKRLFLTHERTLPRKIKEALLSLELERVLTKNRILELYLNQVYFGSGAYGIESAARTYFNKSASALTLPEAALLAGLPKAPSKFSPLRNPDLARQRRNTVLERMAQNGFISQKEAEEAKQLPINLSPGTRPKTRARYFVEVLRRRLESKLGPDQLYTGGLQIVTTLNLDYQEIAENAVRWGLWKVDRKRGWRGPEPELKLAETPPPLNTPAGAEIKSVHSNYLVIDLAGIEKKLMFKDIWIKNRDLKKLKSGDHVRLVVESYDSDQDPKEIKSCYIVQVPDVESALLSLDPTSGEVLAWVGGYDYSRSQFDRVSQSKRQPGSAFKPFIYAAALDSDFTCSDVIYDTPIVVEKTWVKKSEEDLKKENKGEDDGEEEKEYWKPHNYSEEFYGATTLRMGLAKSRNIISIHLMNEVGIPNVIHIARQMGIESPLTNTLSLALGASDVSLLEITKAYGGFAAMGLTAEPMLVKRILDRHGKILFENYPAVRRALRPETAYLTTNLLQGVIQHGTGYKARILDRPVGGKTGTTNKYHDAWFIGFTPQIVTGTWVGVDQFEPIYRKATGASAALPIWLKYMSEVLENYPKIDFPKPPDIVRVPVCYDTGLLPTPFCPRTIQEAFIEGTEPLKFCTKHQPAQQQTTDTVDTDWDSEETGVEPTPTSEPLLDDVE